MGCLDTRGTDGAFCAMNGWTRLAWLDLVFLGARISWLRCLGTSGGSLRGRLDLDDVALLLLHLGLDLFDLCLEA